MTPNLVHLLSLTYNVPSLSERVFEIIIYYMPIKQRCQESFGSLYFLSQFFHHGRKTVLPNPHPVAIRLFLPPDPLTPCLHAFPAAQFKISVF